MIASVAPAAAITANSAQTVGSISISSWNPNYTGTNTTDTVTLKTDSIKWYKLNAAGTAYDEIIDTTVPFVAGGSYKYVATVVIDNADFDDNGINGCVFGTGANTYTGYVTAT